MIEDDATDDATGWGLKWRFVDQSPSFVHGVEAGMIYERMSRLEETIVMTTHAEIEEELRNLANTLGYRASFEPLDDQEFWHATTFTRDKP